MKFQICQEAVVSDVVGLVTDRWLVPLDKIFDSVEEAFAELQILHARCEILLPPTQAETEKVLGGLREWDEDGEVGTEYGRFVIRPVLQEARRAFRKA